MKTISKQQRMNGRSLLLLLTVLCTVATSVEAQTMARYAVTRTTGNSYSSILSSGTAVPSWRNISGGNFNLDDNRSYPVDIGFDFWYRGIRYTQFSVSTNGYLDFSSSTADGGPTTGAYGYQNTAFTNNTALTGTALAVFYDDQTTQGVSDPLGESIKYSTTGVTPNRVLTVEWINMAVYGNTTPDLNYQIKLYESTGIIEFNYSTMTAGTATFSYSQGINAPTQSGTATAAELLVQQTANGTTFNNTEVNNLTALPTSGHRYTFTPLAMNAPHTLSFTSVSQSGMTLNWVDTVWNEVGFAVFVSGDGGANYNFVAQTAANATSYSLSGLLASTTYYVKVFAVNEGRLSSALTGNQMTLAAGAPYSIASGSWKNPATWSTNTVPGISDNATIADNTVITIDSTVTVNSLTVGQGSSGTLLIGNDNTARSITVIGNITVNSGAKFRVNALSNTSSHTITTSGNIDNSGIFVLATDADSRCAATFNKNGTQTISGNGDSTFFYLMTVNLGTSRANLLDIFATNFGNTTPNFLTLTNGTFNLATGAAITPFTAATSLSASSGFRVNHSSAVVTTTGGSLTIAGELKVSNGTVIIGSATGHDLISTGGIFEFGGGTTRVRGGFIPSSAYALTKFTMTNGTLIVADSGSTNTTYAPMNITVTGSEFTMSGGTIIVKKEGGTGAQDLGFSATGITSYSVTGGTVQFGYSGLTTGTNVMRINSAIPIHDLVVNSGTTTAQLITNNLTVRNSVTITAGTLNLNALTLSVAKDWSNSGSLTAATGKVIFNGSGAQTITDASGDTINKVTVSKSGGTLTLVNNVVVSDSFALSVGTVDIGSNTLQLNGIVTGGGTLISGTSGTVNYNRAVAGQTVLETNYGNLTFSNFTKVLPAGTVGIAGTFTSGTAAGHTIAGNTIDYNGNGAQNIASFLYNNLILSNSGIKTQLSGADTVQGILTIGASNTLTVSSDTLRLFGNVVNNGIQDGTNYVELRGASAQTIIGDGSFTNLKIFNINGVTVTGKMTVNGVLRLLTGVISTGTDTLTIASSGSVSWNAGHIYGWLKKNFAVGSNVTQTFEVGDAAAASYRPITFNFATVNTAGYVAVTTVASEPGNISNSFIDPTNNVNRYWQAINSGNFNYTVAAGCSVTVTFLNTFPELDQTGSETSFRMNVYNGVRWDSLTAGTRTATTNMATGVDSLGIYIVGLQSVTDSYRTKASGRWTEWWNTWERFNGVSWVNATTFPKNIDGLISIQSGHTVTVDTNLSSVANRVDQVLVESGGEITITSGGNFRLNNGAGTDLTILGTVKLTGTGVFSSAAATATVTVGSGGVYEHNINGGTITTTTNATTWTWNSSSTLLITGITATVPARLNQTFGNFIWNCASQSAPINLAGNPTTVNGNFDVQNTNGQQLLINDNTAATKSIAGKFAVRNTSKVLLKSTGATAYAVTVGDSLVISGSGSTLRFLTGGGTGAVTVTVSGHTLMNGDSLNLSATATVDSLRLSGNMTHSAGIITETSTGAGWIVFRGTNQQIYTSGGTVENLIHYRVDGASWLKLNPAVTLTGGGNFTLVGSGKLEIGSVNGIASTGATGNIQVTGTRTFSSTGKYVYSGSSAQIQGVFTTTPTARTVNFLEINNSAGVTLSDSITVTDSLKLLSGTLAIGSNTLYISNVALLTSGTLSSNSDGTVNYNKGSNTQSILQLNYGNLILSNFNKTFPAGTVGIAGAFTPGTATGHTLTGNTIDYNGSTPQTVRNWLYYNNLTISGTNWKQLSGTTTVNGNLSISAGTLSDSIYTLTVKGNITNSSLNTSSGSGKTVLSNGTATHTLSGGGRYRILELNDGLGATASSSVSVDSLLILSSGVLSSGANIVSITSYPGVSRSSGHVAGILQKTIVINPVPQLYTFQIGDASNYTPVDVTFQSVSDSGTLQVQQTTPDHPTVKFSGLDEFKSVNRYFTLTGNSITFSTYDATMNFVSGDIDGGANTGYFFVKRYNASWNPSTTNIRNSTSTKTTGITAFGDFAIGEAATTFYWTKGAGTYNWGDDFNWSSHSVPTAGNHVIFDGKDTVEVNVTAVCNDLTIHNDTLRLTILTGNTLTVSGALTQYSGILSTETTFPAVTGSVTLSGGTVGYDGAGAQSIADHVYYNVRLSGGGTKTAAADLTINQNLTIGTSTIFDDGGSFISIRDSVTNNGSHIGSGRIYLYGSTQHQLTGTGSFTNVELDNTSNGVTLDSNLTINGTLTLTNGIITAQNDTLYISSTGSIVPTNGHIYGNLRRFFSVGSDSLEFNVGTASQALPVTVSFGTVTNGGTLTLQMVAGDHPDIVNAGINADSTVNRYWILNNNGIAFNTVNATFRWLGTDVDGGIIDYSDIIVVKRDNGAWSDVTVGEITSTSVRAMNFTSFSAFGVGKGSSETFTSVTTGNWSTAATWDLNRVPKKRDHVVIVSSHTVSLIDDREITNISLNSGAVFADDGYTLDLYGKFIFSGSWSGSGMIRWNDSDQDTLAGTGGKATGTSTLMINGTGKRITAANDTLYRIQIGSSNTITNDGSVRMTRLIGDDASSTWINAAGSSLNVSDTLLTTGTLTATANSNTVIYNGTGSQTIKQTNYHHLTISGSRTTNTVTLPGTSISIAGTFTPTATFTGSGTYITTGNTIDYSGSGAQAIAAFDYNNLTVSGARSSATITLAGSDTIAVAGTLSLTATAVTYANTGSIVDFNGTGAQTIPAFNYNKLRISGARTTNSVTLASGDTIGVADTLNIAASFTAGGYITTGSKIAYNGTGSQTVVPFAYNDLSISNARTTNNVVFAPTDTVKVGGILALSASFAGGALAFTGSTVDFNGTSSQTIPALNYNNLRISGSRTTNNVTLASGTIGIANTFSPAATFSSGTYVVTGNTLNFNGSGAQSIPAFLYYNNLQTSTGGVKSAGGTLKIQGNVTIGSGTTFGAGSTTDTVYGHWTTTGTFTAGTSTIVFAGTQASSITGPTTFHSLTMNKLDSATAVTLVDDISTANLTMTKGTMQTGAKSVTITNTRTGNGIIIGTVTRTHSYSLSTAYAFEGPNSTITFTAGTPPSSVTMTVAQAAPSSPTFVAVNRAVNIAITGGSGLTSTLRLHYENSEANSLNETIMKLWQYSGTWQNRNNSSYDSVLNYIEMAGLTGSLTGDWGIGSSVSTKTVTDINGATAIAGDSLLYTISIMNPYNITKNSILVTDPLDDNLILKSGTISNSGGIAGQSNNGSGSMVGGTISWPGFSLASGASVSRTFTVNTDSSMDVSEAVNNTATIDFGGSNVENVSASISITNIANISIDTNIVSNQEPVPGDTLTYTLKYRNVGTSNATTVTTTYTIPLNTTFVSSAYGAGTGIEVNGVPKTNDPDLDEVSVSGSIITIAIPTLSPGAYQQVKFKTIVN